MALCSNARRFSEDLARVWVVVEKQRAKERDGWEGSLGGMAVVSLLCCALSVERLEDELGAAASVRGGHHVNGLANISLRRNNNQPSSKGLRRNVTWRTLQIYLPAPTYVGVLGQQLLKKGYSMGSR
jgi:hypothetical protein